MTQTNQLSRAFCLKNNSAQVITDVIEPWLNAEPIPPFPTKDAYREWSKNPNTDYCFFSLVEGEVTTMRLGSGNKAHKLHGIVADFDCKNTTNEELDRGIGRCSRRFLPYAWNRTFSGGVRVVWLFEDPVFYYNKDTFKRFVNRCIKEFKIKDLFPHLDDAIYKEDTYYCAGDAWVINSQRTLVTAQSTNLWIAEASKNDDFDGGVEIPIETVAAEVEKRFPGRWDGEFKIGARGVRFWEPGADAKSAIVRPTGMQAFTGDVSFLSWSRIFGNDFVQQFIENRTGAAIRDLYFDGKYFYRQLPDESWAAMNTESAKRHLQVNFSLSSEKDGEPASEVDVVLHRIESTKCVIAALPFPHNPNRIVRFNGKNYLNISNAKLWPAALDEQEWGENFAWIANYLSSLFENEDSLLAFLCWAHVWVKSLHEGEPRKGHALFIIGPPGTGKTLLSTQILGRIVGGFAEATQFLVDGNQYNNSLFENALWTIDDAVAGADARAHAKFSAALKAVVANSTFHYEKKHGSAGDLSFSGRVVVTLNEDPNSLSIIPDTDHNLTDKIIIVRTGDTPADVAEKESDRYKVIEQELSAFVRFLIDFKIPDSVDSDKRFGFKAYHDPSTLEEARSATVGSTILEAVDTWRKLYSESADKDTFHWKGTASEMYAALNQLDATRGVVSKMSSVWLGRHLNQAIANKCPWMHRFRESDGSRMIRINLIKPAPKK